MKKILIYGVGNNCERLYKYGDLSDVEVIGFADKYKCGSTYRNKMIIHPSEIAGVSVDEILVTPYGSDKIISELTKEFYVDKSKLRNVEYINKNYLLRQIKDRKFIFFELIGVFECIYSEVLRRNDTLLLCLLNDKSKWKIEIEKDFKEKVFIFAINVMEYYYSNDIFEYLRSSYICSKQVMILYDQIDGEYGLKNRYSYFDIDNLKSKMDRLLTYHKGNAYEYKIEQMDMVYSDLSNEIENSEIEYDVLFLGHAKNRLNKLYSIYDKLSHEGYICSFWLVGVDEDEKRLGKGINYVDIMNYKEYLNLLSKSKAVLEVCDSGDESTLRYYESVLFHKKLLTDDIRITKKKYYNKDNMYYFSVADDLEPEWLDIPMADYNYENDYSPNRLLEYLENI